MKVLKLYLITLIFFSCKHHEILIAKNIQQARIINLKWICKVGATLNDFKNESCFVNNFGAVNDGVI